MPTLAVFVVATDICKREDENVINEVSIAVPSLFFKVYVNAQFVLFLVKLVRLVVTVPLLTKYVGIVLAWVVIVA